MSPEISIIVPSFNAQEYISDCLDSILGQSFTGWELLIADDGSDDRTGDIAEAYAAKDSRIKVIRSTGQGVSSARNACLETAEGKYLAYVDADDTLEPDYLKELFDRAEQSNSDIVQCSFFVDDNGRITPYPDCPDKIYEDPEQIMRAYFAGTHGDIRDSVWAKLFRREAFPDIRFDTGLSIFEDSYYVYHCCRKACKVLSFNTPLYHYVQHGGSATHSRIDERYEDFLSVFAKQKTDFTHSAYYRKRISCREAETALWLMRIMVNNGNKNAAWELRRKTLGITCDVIWSPAPFAIKLKLAAAAVMPHLYFTILKGRTDQDNEKV